MYIKNGGQIKGLLIVFDVVKCPFAKKITSIENVVTTICNLFSVSNKHSDSSAIHFDNTETFLP